MSEIVFVHRSEHNQFNALCDDKIVGYLDYRFPDDSSGQRNLELIWVEVMPAYQRRGIARGLVIQLLDNFQDKKWISLWTGEAIERTGGWKLYGDLGFVEQAYQNDYYGDGLGTRLMAYRRLR
jgi:ribosomal protein S18 acetylase RimI-like enzyme